MVIYIFGDDWKPLLYLNPMTKAYSNAIKLRDGNWQNKFSKEIIIGNIKEYIMTSGTLILLREEEGLCE